MASQLYNLTISSFVNGLNALTHILQKAEAHAKEKGIPLEDLFNARLYEDMRPLPFQIQVATTHALKVVARATQTEPIVLEHNETSYDQLYVRINKAIELVKGTDVAVFTSLENTPFKAPIGPSEIEFTTESYLSKFGFPNFYFHVTTAYAILRSKGVPLGKIDYLGAFVQGQ